MGIWKLLFRRKPRRRVAEPVFVAPPPPHEEPNMNKPRARLCKLEKSSQSEEFGFNLHAEKGRGHFIGTVDQGGIGDRAGLRMGQRIVGVNGVLVYPNTPHKEVVAQIKRSPLRTTLLVASEEVDKWYKEHGAEFSFDYVEEDPSSHQNHHQQISPHSIQISDDEEFPDHRHKPQPQSADEHLEPIEIEEVHEVEEPPAPEGETVTAELQGDMLEAVFSAIPSLSVAEDSTEEELLAKSQELPPQDLLVAAAAVRPPSHTNSTHSSHESGVDEQQKHYVPTYQPKRQEAPQVSPPSNGSSLNGYQTSSDSVSPVADKFDIFGLSAQEARERLRQNKKNIHRGFDMSLEEKYRLVSNM